MPAWLTWSALRALPWRWIGLGLAVLSLVLWIDHRGYSRGFHKRDAEVANITRDRDTHASNERILQGALARQNAAVAALQADGDKRTAEGKTALQATQKANKPLDDKAKDLRRSATLKPAAGDPCVVSETLAKVGKL